MIPRTANAKNGKLSSIQPLAHLRCTLLPLTSIEGQAALSGLKRDLGALGKIENIAGNRMHLLARLVGDVK